MYTYLNQKYGLKTLIVEWASLIISGVKTYLRDDHEITLFAKILKNECDEDFRFVQMHVRESIMNVLKQILREKSPLKPEAEIARECETIQNGCIEEWQWKKVITKMYERDDANLLCARYYQMIQDRAENSSGQIGNFIYNKLKSSKKSANKLVYL